MLNYIVWDVTPQIIKLNSFEIRWYGLLFAGGFFGAYYVLTNVFNKEGIAIEKLDKLTMYVFLGTLIGARLGHCLFYEPAYYLENPLRILKIWEGGLASHGAAIGILLSIILFAKKEKVAFPWLMARVAIVVPLAGACIRFGTLMNSEIYGMPTEVAWAFIFVRESPLPRHPTQIYEALFYLATFGYLYWYYLRSKTKINNDYTFGIFLILLFASRFFIEYLKEVQVEFEQSMALDMGQLLSIPFVLFGIYLVIKSRKVNTIKN